MKNIFYALVLFTGVSFAQGRSISLKSKITTPYTTIDKKIVNVSDKIVVKEGSNPDGTFKYVQVLNGLNEPIYQADSKSAYKKQLVLFFKEQDETIYLFTKFYCINIEAALNNGEIEIVK